MIIKAVLINVKADRREGLGHPTEYTLGLWKDKGLVPVARIAATSALEDTTALNQWVIQHTTQRFGLTYAVEPSLVLEIAFEGITLSRRHKSGFSLCTPHITRWLKGMHAQEADNLECLTRMASVPCEKTAPTPDIPSTFNLFGKK
jgi:DNA ligase-1